MGADPAILRREFRWLGFESRAVFFRREIIGRAIISGLEFRNALGRRADSEISDRIIAIDRDAVGIGEHAGRNDRRDRGFNRRRSGRRFYRRFHRLRCRSRGLAAGHQDQGRGRHGGQRNHPKQGHGISV